MCERHRRHQHHRQHHDETLHHRHHHDQMMPMVKVIIVMKHFTIRRPVPRATSARVITTRQTQKHSKRADGIQPMLKPLRTNNNNERMRITTRANDSQKRERGVPGGTGPSSGVTITNIQCQNLPPLYTPKLPIHFCQTLQKTASQILLVLLLTTSRPMPDQRRQCAGNALQITRAVPPAATLEAVLLQYHPGYFNSSPV